MSMLRSVAPRAALSSTLSASAGVAPKRGLRSLSFANRTAPLSGSNRSHAARPLPRRTPAVSLGRRTFTTSGTRQSQQPFQYLSAYAFQGKPRIAEDAAQEGDAASSSDSQAQPDEPIDEAKQVKIGFPPETEIGQWRDELLRGGEAGEDSLMCTQMGTSGDLAIGVADGVGGWTENGVDPSLFSQALMFHAAKAASNSSAHPDRIDSDAKGMTPEQMLADAFEKVLKEPMVVAGSATACILTMDSTKGVLRSANLGDSGFVVLRQGTGKQGVYYASPPQQLGFNTPLQLAKLPKEWIQDGSISNMPKDAALWHCSLRHGDLIIVGTDGLFDNVDAKNEIPQFAKFIKEKHHAAYTARTTKGDTADGKAPDTLDEDREFVQVLATNLMEYAKICQNTTTKQSPFEREAARHGIHYPGGKVDDVALVCCLVIER